MEFKDETKRFDAIEAAISNIVAVLGPEHRSIIDYDDHVYRVTVPSGALLVRRNGVPLVSGNCMTMRGVQKPGTRTVTSALRGVMREKPETRAEFLRLVGR